MEDSGLWAVLQTYDPGMPLLSVWQIKLKVGLGFRKLRHVLILMHACQTMHMHVCLCVSVHIVACLYMLVLAVMCILHSWELRGDLQICVM